MKKTNWLAAALMAVSLSVALAPSLAEAKRLGGGRSSGMQRQAPDAPQRTSPMGQPQQAGAPGQQAVPAQTPSPAAAGAAAAAAKPKRSWMGPLAGLAAGLGLAALMSHFGLGEAFADFMMLALLALVAVVAIRFVMARMAGGGRGRAGSPGLATAGAGAGSALGAEAAWPGTAREAGVERRAEPAPLAPAAFGGSGPRPVAVPASFDSEGFERTAKALFIRLQAANDAGDLNDLRQFTTPEIFAELKLDLQERGGSTQTTDVVAVRAEVIEVAQDGERQIVSVRYQGQVREETGGPVADFDEVWHLVRVGDQPSWLIAGIQQRP